MGRGGGRTDYTLLKEGQNALFDEESGKNKATVWRLMGLAQKEAWLLVIATVFLFVSSLATVAVPKLAGELIDVCIKFHAGSSEGKEEAKKHLNHELYEILGILAVGAIGSGMRSWLFNGAAERVMCRLRSRLFGHLMSQEIGFFDRIRTGELMNRLSEDTRLMKSAGTISISIALRATVVSIFGLVLMFVTSPLLTGLTLAILPVLLVAFASSPSSTKSTQQKG
ncbi:hypothetical protein WJX84_007363 [Apatococcus fuscideae]|uniref:ABC transmembrane type-1 domain-containing protein n=1 Tax=Apatococcus fuscideae TaxID=2026836 RepID=A0AAW1SYU7_9CHLO